jgi:hypothetical protein
VSSEQGQSGGQDQEPAATHDERAMKACPDCAEMILEAARKCRYCGYRYDAQPAQEGLFAHLFRRSAPHLTMTETLQQLGVALEPGERTTGLWLGQVKSIDGYVVLTDARLVFVIGLRHQQGSPAPWQHRLDELAGAEITSHRWKAVLLLHWRDSPDMRIDGMAQKDLQRLHAALLDRVRS